MQHDLIYMCSAGKNILFDFMVYHGVLYSGIYPICLDTLETTSILHFTLLTKKSTISVDTDQGAPLEQHDLDLHC